MAEPSDADLDALVEQATVDAYDEYGQLASLHAVIKASGPPVPPHRLGY